MARKPKPDIGHNSGGPTKGDILAADTEIMEAARESREAANRLGAVKKRLKKSGVDVALVVALQKERDKDEATRLAQEIQKRRYASWMSIKLDDGAAAPQDEVPADATGTDAEEQGHREALAQDAGYRCGKLGTDRTTSNTYPPGSPMHVAFDKGWLQGWTDEQTRIATEMGENAKMADSSKKKPEVAGADAR